MSTHCGHTLVDQLEAERAEKLKWFSNLTLADFAFKCSFRGCSSLVIPFLVERGNFFEGGGCGVPFWRKKYLTHQFLRIFQLLVFEDGVD